MENIFIKTQEKKELSVLESEKVVLRESDSAKVIKFIFKTNEAHGLLTSSYKAILNIGDNRKN